MSRKFNDVKVLKVAVSVLTVALLATLMSVSTSSAEERKIRRQIKHMYKTIQTAEVTDYGCENCDEVD